MSSQNYFEITEIAAEKLSPLVTLGLVELILNGEIKKHGYAALKIDSLESYGLKKNVVLIKIYEDGKVYTAKHDGKEKRISMPKENFTALVLKFIEDRRYIAAAARMAYCLYKNAGVENDYTLKIEKLLKGKNGKDI